MTTTAAPHIARLGHVGIHCLDLAAQEAFYTDVLGLYVTDRDDEGGLVFLSAQPDVEHHEVLLCRGRDVPVGSKVIQQVSFRCDSYGDVEGFYQRLKSRNVALDRVVTHGNAIGVYFMDPEGNRCEVYWNTGLEARQPFGVPANLDESEDEVMGKVRAAVAEFGKTGTRVRR